MRSSRIAATAGRTTSTMSAILLITLQGRLAPFLLKLLQAELEHEAKPDLIRRCRDPDIRDTCGELLYFIILWIELIIVTDYCWTSLFSAGWMCQHCGWEVCNECLCLLPSNSEKPEVYLRCLHACL